MNKRFHELMTKYFLGSATEEEFKEFEKLIEENDDLRLEYIEQTMIETDMKSISVEAGETVETKPAKSFPLWLAAAVIILIPVLYFASLPAGVGVISSSESAAWESNQPTLPGTEFRPGKFKLHSGLATLSFHSGADVTIEAPATIEVISDMQVNLLKGSVSVHVHKEEAQGFRVDTPYGHAIDHGTRFTVKIKEDKQAAEFVVKEGEISIHHESGKSKWLKTEESSQMNANDLSEISSADLEEPMEPEITSLIISSKDHETTVVSNDDMNRIRRKFLLTKLQGERSGMNRRGLFAFRIDQVNRSDIQSAALSLNYIRLGDAIDMPAESEFELYGISEDQSFQAVKYGAKWKEVPQIEQATFLEEFKIPRSKQTDRIIFKSAKIDDYLKDSTGSFVGFIIVCKTKTPNLHHAFASSHNQEYSGPQLELIVK